MIQEQKTIYDVDGSEKISSLLMNLLNEYPGLDGGVIEFSTLVETGGIGFFPSAGAVLMLDEHYITGYVHQICRYPFDIIYRASPRSEEQKIRVKEFLDGLGRWLERQPVMIDGNTYKIDAYPDIESGSRRIRNITRTSPSHLMMAGQDGVQDWVISLELDYENNFYKE